MTLSLDNVRFSAGKFSLEISAEIGAGCTAIYGPSAAGKTTLLEMICGLRKPENGCIALDGIEMFNTKNACDLPPEERRASYLPQDGAVFPHFSVRRNLLYGWRAEHERSTGLTFDHVIQVLEIGDLMDRSALTLSGGEKQRVSLGRALLANPRLLLLDEPLSGLDAPLKARVLPYLIRVRDEFRIPILYVTHSAEEVMALCERTFVLEKGRVVQSGKSSDLFGLSDRPNFELRSKGVMRVDRSLE